VKIKQRTRNPSGSPQVTCDQTRNEYKSFEALTRKLTKVSKSELDEQRKRS
jgi:hypothetical protein